MLKLIGCSMLALVVGYGAGLFGGMFLLDKLSSNTHDKSVEAAMTAAFVIGPITALLALGLTLGYLLTRRRR
jgi:uncharacterized protein YneF (UPF0154 family)